MLVWRKGTRVGFEKKRCAAPEKLKWPMVGDVVHTNQDGIFLQQVKRAISASIKVFA